MGEAVAQGAERGVVGERVLPGGEVRGVRVAPQHLLEGGLDGGGVGGLVTLDTVAPPLLAAAPRPDQGSVAGETCYKPGTGGSLGLRCRGRSWNDAGAAVDS